MNPSETTAPAHSAAANAYQPLKPPRPAVYVRPLSKVSAGAPRHPHRANRGDPPGMLVTASDITPGRLSERVVPHAATQRCAICQRPGRDPTLPPARGCCPLQCARCRLRCTRRPLLLGLLRRPVRAPLAVSTPLIYGALPRVLGIDPPST